MAFLDPVLNPVLKPLLEMSPFITILIVGFVISLLITLVYKFFTNQEEMKRLKDQQKEYQVKMKTLKDNPAEMMKVQKEAMSLNMDYMKHSFKATLITMLPIILIFGWMSGHLAFEPIYPEESYSVTAFFGDNVGGEAELVVDEGTNLLSEVKQKIEGPVTWKLKGQEGEHFLVVKVGETEQTKKVLITKKLEYAEPISLYQHSDIEKIQINYNKLKPLGPNFTVPLFNWQPGWLGIYIIFSIVFSMVMRKALKIY
ncbi:MAG: DUF106 domain-containing protein [Nanoarchaeota archaeon]|nr:DUF106 domain-containing protein [Nanoarchaeota archaeon]MBU1644466.1 DUF106 domain-containing protein [Nanoarchaeota archaeon]MBU1976470.1 DUF106 domain-containing protein [Nanoarchaeota archaeon]